MSKKFNYTCAECENCHVVDDCYICSTLYEKTGRVVEPWYKACKRFMNKENRRVNVRVQGKNNLLFIFLAVLTVIVTCLLMWLNTKGYISFQLM